MHLLDEERHLILLALAHLAVRTPVWEPALQAIAAKYDGEEMFAYFKAMRLESLRQAASLPPFSQGQDAP